MRFNNLKRAGPSGSQPEQLWPGGTTLGYFHNLALLGGCCAQGVLMSRGGELLLETGTTTAARRVNLMDTEATTAEAAKLLLPPLVIKY